MKNYAFILVALLIGSAVAVTSSTAFAEEYLYDALAKPGYQKSWNALLRSEKNIPAWLAQYANTNNGPTTPGTEISLGDARYQIHNVCKAHDCGDNMFYVLFALDGARAWGLLLTKDKGKRFFGNPDEAKKDALLGAARE